MRELRAKEESLKAKEESLLAREEKLRHREEQVALEERAIQLREQQLQHEAHNLRSTTHSSENESAALKAPSQRQTNSCCREDEDYRRMSLAGGCEEDELEEPTTNITKRSDKSGFGTTPFLIYCDSQSDTRAPVSNKDDFTTGVARARELLGRPRLMARATNSCCENDAGSAKVPQEKSAFYRNYLNSRQTDNALSENIDPSKPQVSLCVDVKSTRVVDVSRSMRHPPAPPPFTQRRRYPPSGGNIDSNCGSATKRPRHEGDIHVAGIDAEKYSATNLDTVPSVHIDLQSMLANGKQRVDCNK